MPIVRILRKILTQLDAEGSNDIRMGLQYLELHLQIQLKEISLTDRLEYIESISANQAVNKINTPWVIIITCTIGGIIIGILAKSVL